MPSFRIFAPRIVMWHNLMYSLVKHIKGQSAYPSRETLGAFLQTKGNGQSGLNLFPFGFTPFHHLTDITLFFYSSLSWICSLFILTDTRNCFRHLRASFHIYAWNH